MLTERAAGLGAVNWIPLRDQVIRRVPLLVSVGGTLYPSLPLETLRVALQETTVFVRSSGGSGVPAFGQRTGVESVRVGYDRAADRRQRRTVAALRAPRPAPLHLRRTRSSTAASMQSRSPGATSSSARAPWACSILRATPLDSAVPGVEIHAQALEQMLAGDHLVRPGLTPPAPSCCSSSASAPPSPG